MNTYISTGRFAKIANTTKRTVQWYKKKDLLKPFKTNSKGYGFYMPEQVIDLQTIMLLRKLNFSLTEIKKLMRANSSWNKVFKEKQQVLEQEFLHLQKNLKDIENFYKNLEEEGVLVKPIIKQQKTFDCYTVEKVGSYSKIYGYCLELKSYFQTISQDATFFALFPTETYAPQKDTFKIGVVIAKGMEIKKDAFDKVKLETISGFKSLSYMHVGSPSLLSLLIMQLKQYQENKKLKKDKKIGFNQLEFYYKSGLNDFHDENFMISEINLPIL